MSWFYMYFICKDCGTEFQNSDDIITENTFDCPKCHSKNTEMDKSKEFTAIKVEERLFKERFKNRPKRFDLSSQ